MTNILITGATGNVGMSLIKALHDAPPQFRVYAGVRNLDADSGKMADYNVECLPFDFMDLGVCTAALSCCDLLFLLRPPQIADVATYFKPIIEACKQNGVQHIVFLSVQGADKNTMIPHHKIEQLIINSQIPYTFLRPAYFMQNFITTLQHDLVQQKRIYLPAGKALFTLIDVRDIGAVAARILTNTTAHKQQHYDLTAAEPLSFAAMAAILTQRLCTPIRYNSPSLLAFFWTKRQKGVPSIFIFVMIMLHYLPRFQKVPPTTQCVHAILNRPPISFEQFVDDHKECMVG